MSFSALINISYFLDPVEYDKMILNFKDFYSSGKLVVHSNLEFNDKTSHLAFSEENLEKPLYSYKMNLIVLDKLFSKIVLLFGDKKDNLSKHVFIYSSYNNLSYKEMVLNIHEFSFYALDVANLQKVASEYSYGYFSLVKRRNPLLTIDLPRVGSLDEYLNCILKIHESDLHYFNGHSEDELKFISFVKNVYSSKNLIDFLNITNYWCKISRQGWINYDF